MMRSLRLRFFLIMWPLVVVAVGGVAYAFARWTNVQLTTRVLGRADPSREALWRRADSIASQWSRKTVTDSELSAALRRIALRDSVDLVVINDSGEIAARSDERITLEHPLHSLPTQEPVAFLRKISAGGQVSEDLVAVSGRPVMDAKGIASGVMFLIPRPEVDPAANVASLRADARRTLWLAVAIASVFAALTAVLLARPLIRQVRALSAAADRIRGGDLTVRVPPTSRDELGALAVGFNDMAATLERAEAHKRNLVHDVAHELRTPLTNILGTLEAIEDNLRPADATTVATLRTEAGLLSALVNDLQDISLAESGQLALDLTDVDVVSEVRDAVDAMRHIKRGVALEASDITPVWARADVQRLQQVLRNLLRNALTHTPDGGTVRVNVKTEGAEVSISVIDTGCGIPESQLPLVWERFHRVDPSRSRDRGGRGLGLAIVKQFVEAMGGRVGVTSVEGKGSTFEVRLQRQQPL
jgi:signal transduction histidine kinase